MRKLLLALPLFAAVPLMAQMPKDIPGKLDAKRVTGGTYAVDTNHTLVAWTVNHLGFNDYFGLFGGITGTMTLNPAKPRAANVSIDIPVNGLTTTNPKLNAHLSSPDFFNVAQFPSAKFVSTMVMAKGNSAMIHGNLTLHGVTKPVVLNARFSGAGGGMMPPHPETIGFQATATIKRSDFGMGGFVPFVSDAVDLRITAAFEKQ
jgi:polyisoprenoid-binding protein YceI